MNQVKIISTFLKYLCYFLAIGYSLTFIYSVICLLTGLWTLPYGDGNYIHILYPFTNEPFINLDNNIKYFIFSFLLPIGFYGIFFGLTAQVSSVFLKSRIFTKENQGIFERYFMLNTYIPLPMVLIGLMFVEVEGMIWILVFIHLILGIFSLFLANICKQGLHLQNEQDLII
ncbi:hypothetical protein [Sphingobacterium cellulitidis]|uniref:hypothetical protein n=1 Tax=Sphingobacterium cellulitidis TaxID=1768011 RepID=UPI000B93BE65|nr:hypothetical protein [Sphingobacterium soli]MBA8986076.1 hypothetical protein [Sphingobacterium soli]OYD40275.1 hypothetical protein CHT99_19110 [Sphingobacterium cellulitidis]